MEAKGVARKIILPLQATMEVVQQFKLAPKVVNIILTVVVIRPMCLNSLIFLVPIKRNT